MDTELDDNMIKMIENKLSNEIDENLLLGNSRNQGLAEDSIYHMQPVLKVGRAEYLKSVREECQRILSETQSLDYRVKQTNNENPSSSSEIPSSVSSILQYEKQDSQAKSESHWFNINEKAAVPTAMEAVEGNEERNINEEKAFKSLMIRTIIAIVIFGAIFLLDQLQFKVGNFSYQTIEQYMTGNDVTEIIEKYVVSLLKK